MTKKKEDFFQFSLPWLSLRTAVFIFVPWFVPYLGVVVGSIWCLLHQTTNSLLFLSTFLGFQHFIVCSSPTDTYTSTSFIPPLFEFSNAHSEHQTSCLSDKNGWECPVNYEAHIKRSNIDSTGALRYHRYTFRSSVKCAANDAPRNCMISMFNLQWTKANCESKNEAISDAWKLSFLSAKTQRETEPWRQEENERKVVEIKNYLFPNDSNGTKEPLSIGVYVHAKLFELKIFCARHLSPEPAHRQAWNRLRQNVKSLINHSRSNNEESFDGSQWITAKALSRFNPDFTLKPNTFAGHKSRWRCAPTEKSINAVAPREYLWICNERIYVRWIVNKTYFGTADGDINKP